MRTKKRGNRNSTVRQVFVACRTQPPRSESWPAGAVWTLGAFTFCLGRDSPQLRTFDDIVAALPPGVKHVIFDDVEYLLPPERRDPKSVAAFLERMKGRYEPRGFHLFATVTSPAYSKIKVEEGN